MGYNHLEAFTPLVSQRVRLYLKKIQVWLNYHDSPTPVRSLREYHIHYHIELRYFTRGLPNFRGYYDERSHYLAYSCKFLYTKSYSEL